MPIAKPTLYFMLLKKAGRQRWRYEMSKEIFLFSASIAVVVDFLFWQGRENYKTLKHYNVQEVNFLKYFCHEGV